MRVHGHRVLYIYEGQQPSVWDSDLTSALTIQISGLAYLSFPSCEMGIGKSFFLKNRFGGYMDAICKALCTVPDIWPYSLFLRSMFLWSDLGNNDTRKSLQGS